MKKLLVIIICGVSFGHTMGQGQSSENEGVKLVKWISFEEAVQKSKVEKRKIFIDVYTDWCGWCKVMDAKTFTDPVIAKLLNEKYYAVKLDAEQKGDIKFDDRTFKYMDNGGGRGVHQLAAALLNNKMSYPNFVFLDEEYRIVPIYSGESSIPGYHTPEQFHIYLDFVGNDIFKSKNIDQYKKSGYSSPY